MSNSINRGDLARELASHGGYLDVKDLDPQVRAALNRAGVSDQQLAHIAGKNGEISGKEFEALFDGLDRLDRDGDRSTIALETAAAKPTLAGAALEELRAEIQRQRNTAGHDGIIHLGMRPASSREAEALRSAAPGKQGGVHEIRAYENRPVEAGGRSFDLSDPAQIRPFVATLGLSASDSAKLERTLTLAPPDGRDELANLALALRDVGTAKLHADRLVLSGHGDGTNLVDDNHVWVKHESFREVMALFPDGAGKIRDLAFSSCFSGTNTREWEAWKRVLPNLQSILGYAEFSPSAERGAPADLRRWANQSTGNAPGAVDPTRSSVATWNRVDGDQNLVNHSPQEARRIADRAEAVLARYSARAQGSGLGDPAAMRAYVQVSQAVNSANLPPGLLARLKHLKDDLYPITHR
jgi:hypothetical protein